MAPEPGDLFWNFFMNKKRRNARCIYAEGIGNRFRASAAAVVRRLGYGGMTNQEPALNKVRMDSKVP